MKGQGLEKMSRGITCNLGSNTCKGPELGEVGACSKEEVAGFGPVFATRLMFLFLAPLVRGGACKL